jgi:pimeloyl-ACP methyl ester carboxylesterase
MTIPPSSRRREATSGPPRDPVSVGRRIDHHDVVDLRRTSRGPDHRFRDPVLLLNGLNRPMQSWAYFGDALRGRTVIALDVPGVGAGETPVVYSMAMLSDIAVRVLDEFGVATADVVGFSFGGAVVQQIAFGHPSRVNRLVLLATSCGVGSVPGRAHDVTRILLRPNDGTRWAQPDPLGLLWQIAAISTWSSIGDLGRIELEVDHVAGQAMEAFCSASDNVGWVCKLRANSVTGPTSEPARARAAARTRRGRSGDRRAAGRTCRPRSA